MKKQQIENYCTDPYDLILDGAIRLYQSGFKLKQVFIAFRYDIEVYGISEEHVKEQIDNYVGLREEDK